MTLEDMQVLLAVVTQTVAAVLHAQQSQHARQVPQQAPAHGNYDSADEMHYRKLGHFNGHSWKDWAFQFRGATRGSNAETCRYRRQELCWHWDCPMIELPQTPAGAGLVRVSTQKRPFRNLMSTCFRDSVVAPELVLAESWAQAFRPMSDRIYTTSIPWAFGPEA